MKTVTLGAENPVVTLLEGHHDVDTFNRAFAKEGWDHAGWNDEHLSFEYWQKHDERHWSPSVKTDPKAVPVTVGDW